MEAVQQHAPYFRWRKIDIREWDSEVARQHGIQSVPALWLYDGRELLTKDKAEVTALLNRLARAQ